MSSSRAINLVFTIDLGRQNHAGFKIKYWGAFGQQYGHIVVHDQACRCCNIQTALQKYGLNSTCLQSLTAGL